VESLRLESGKSLLHVRGCHHASKIETASCLSGVIGRTAAALALAFGREIDTSTSSLLVREKHVLTHHSKRLHLATQGWVRGFPQVVVLHHRLTASCQSGRVGRNAPRNVVVASRKRCDTLSQSPPMVANHVKESLLPQHLAIRHHVKLKSAQTVCGDNGPTGVTAPSVEASVIGIALSTSSQPVVVSSAM